MINKDIDKFDAIFKRNHDKRMKGIIPSLPGRSCISEEALEDYLDHNLSAGMVKSLESHLSKCQTCFARLHILRGIKIEERSDVPRHLINRAKDLVADTRANCLELILGIARDTIHIIRHSGTLLSPEPVLEPIRGRLEAGTKSSTDYVAAKKSFGDIAVDIQIECINEAYKLMVNSLDMRTGESPENMRLILSSMGRELNSVDDNEAVFYIKLKSYLINIIHSGKIIGDIRLDLRELPG